MSNPGDPQDDAPKIPEIVTASIAAAGSDIKPASKDVPATVAGEPTGGVDIEALALRVYALLKEEVRIERERSVRS